MPVFVIDTNVVLDTWWFEDPRCHTLGRAVAGTPGSWCHTIDMRDELIDVLQREPFRREQARCERTLLALETWSLRVDRPPTPAPWLCADPDDQPFLDLAMQLRPSWLLTRDRALLDLAGRAASAQVQVLSPLAWADRIACATAAPVPAKPG